MLDLLLKHISLQGLIWAIVLIPLASSAINWTLAIFSSRFHSQPKIASYSSFFGTVGPILSFIVTLIVFWVLTGIEGSDSSAITGPLFQWLDFKDWGVDVSLKADQLSLVMSLVVAGVGSLIHIYSIGYMDGDEGYSRYFAELNLFLFFMLLLVLADNLLLMFVGWEGVGLCSYLLIGFWFKDIDKARAGTKAFVVNRIGDVGFIVALMLVFSLTTGQGFVGKNIFNFEVISRNMAFLVPMATPIALLLFLGACGKSAQIPLYVWLPDAMAGPTPVSALIHAATMVTAGVYMVARLNFLYVISPFAMNVIAIVGTATAFFAAIVGLTQRDIKKVLAYSTISQLGYMFLAAGVGAFEASIFHLVTHAFFKAVLFLAAGSVIHSLHGEQDMFNMGGLKKYLPGTFAAFFVAALAISGIWPLAGFFSKDDILWEVYSRGNFGLWLVAFVTSGMTAFYIFRAVSLTFFGRSRLPEEKKNRIHESSVSMLVPLVLLGLLSVGGGLLKNPLNEFISPLFASAIVTKIQTHKNLEIILAIISVVWAVHWAFVAWIIYVQKPSWPAAFARSFSRTYKLLTNSFFIDKLYEYLVVKPVYFISDTVLRKGIDEPLIDEIGVNGTGRSVGLVGRIAQATQTGLAAHYLFFMVLGVTIIICWLVF